MTAAAAEAQLLTASQRLQIETQGYIIVENVLSVAETSRLRQDIYDIEHGWRAGPQGGEIPEQWDPNHHSWLTANSPEFWRIDNIPHLGSSFLEYTTHRRLTAIVEEMIGVKIRLEQSDAHIRRQAADNKTTEQQQQQRPGFHAGPHTSGVGPYGRHSSADWYKFAYVKTLTNLTDLNGAEDGGTLVIPGSVSCLLFCISDACLYVHCPPACSYAHAAATVASFVRTPSSTRLGPMFQCKMSSMPQCLSQRPTSRKSCTSPRARRSSSSRASCTPQASSVVVKTGSSSSQAIHHRLCRHIWVAIPIQRCCTSWLTKVGRRLSGSTHCSLAATSTVGKPIVAGPTLAMGQGTRFSVVS